ncbi:formimidoylglutamase [Virgibacillus dakarensis]|uniref:formimidoylglutamase n=1 Tax=Bacillaceae TaxID=186817 RepID=UPI000B44D89A|nr:MULTISPECIES: formimidoylglutamase [Bacillaceae]MBT2216307.1 formimidoylglutamase [Virgibacillus dakarensis]
MYRLANGDLWSGRIDSDNASDYRFHQVIKLQNIDKLKQSESAFGFIGFASDEGVRRNKGRAGASLAPDEIRKHLAKLPYNLNRNMETIDYGNVICEDDQLEKAQEELGKKVYSLLLHHKTPIILGGGHETFYGHYLGVREYFSADKTIGIVNIDAHFDLRSDKLPSSGTMFRQILEQDVKAGYLCLGIQEFGNTRSLFQAAKDFGCQYVLEEDINLNNIQNTYEKIDEFIKKYDSIIMTLCTDSIISSAAPGVSAPSPLGLDPKIVKRLLKYIAAKKNTISFDISEVNPNVDENDKTVRLAAYLVAETMKSFSLKEKLAMI